MVACRRLPGCSLLCSNSALSGAARLRTGHKPPSGESVSQSPLKDRPVSTFTNQNLRSEQQHILPGEPSRQVAAAPSKNVENNPMQSRRRSPQPMVLDRQVDTSGKSAAEFHPQRARASNGCCPVSSAGRERYNEIAKSNCGRAVGSCDGSALAPTQKWNELRNKVPVFSSQLLIS